MTGDSGTRLQLALAEEIGAWMLRLRKEEAMLILGEAGVVA